MNQVDRSSLRHAIAVLAYRGGKAMRGARPEFAAFDTGGGHTPLVVAGHLSDLLDWALSHARGRGKWVSAPLQDWAAQVARFHAALAALDNYLASDDPVHCELHRLLQGPVADALTHVGQLMILRRMSGDPVHGENYFAAEIETGRVGEDQAAPVRPF